MISLDTNILLPAVESRNAHHPRAAAFLESLQDRQDVALCEFIRKRPKIAPIDGFWAEPAFQALSRAARYCSAMRAGVRAAACTQFAFVPFTYTHPMTDATAIHGHDIIDLVATYPEGIRLSQLMEVVDERFGKSVTFHTGSAMGMDLDGLLRFLEARDKVQITKGVVYSGGSPACEH